MAQKRAWVAVAQFDGRPSFYVGTVFAEGELEAEREALDLWGKVIPYPPPRVLQMIPGQIIFSAEE